MEGGERSSREPTVSVKVPCAANGRGNVIYMRYDGHYGLIGPAR